MSFYTYGFEGQVDILHYDGFDYSVVFLPDDVHALLPFDIYPRLRIEGEINEHAFSGALIPSSSGRHLILGASRLKDFGLKVGSSVELRFNIADQDSVEVPEELVNCLSADLAAETAWNELTPGRQRGLAHTVASAKTAMTREKRALEIVRGLGGQAGGKLPTPRSKTKTAETSR